MFGYKATELREIEYTYFDTCNREIREVWGLKNKNKKGKGKLVGKVIKDTYGRVFRVHLIPKSETDKTLKTAMLYAKQMLEQELLDESSGE